MPSKTARLVASISPIKETAPAGEARAKSRVVYAGLDADWQESARPDNSPAMSQFRAIVFALRHNFRLHLNFP